MEFLRGWSGQDIGDWGIVLGFAVLVAYILALHRRNSTFKKQLETVNQRLTHMQEDVRRYLSTISKLTTAPTSPPIDLPPPVSEEKPRTPSSSVKVLVADDNPELLTLMQEVLEANGYAVTPARTGIEALDFIATGRPDIVVLDILMPQMNGLELLQKMRERRVNTPVLIITVYSEAAESTREFDNVKGIVLKPLHVEDLLNRVNEIRRQIQ